MNSIEVKQTGGNIVVNGLEHFCLDDILGCGQCFRWEKTGQNLWRGIVAKRTRTVGQNGGTLTIYGADSAEFDAIWYNYFDFGRDYGVVKQILSLDKAMQSAICYTPGMRVLKQEPWEALCSFILSQNNNIKRICGLVSRLCEQFGEKIDGGFAFPSPETLACLSEADLLPVRSGFRAKYVIDAAKKVASGEIHFPAVQALPLLEAQLLLQKISGVGPKVAACALLYGFGRVECVPRDVWINRAMAYFYPSGMPENILDIAGLGQQYLFHYIRNNSDMLELSAKK